MSKVDRSKWPQQYRLTYKLPSDFDWSYKYTQSTTDEQAIASFHGIFEHLRKRLGKSSDPKKAPLLKAVERYDKYEDKWIRISFTGTEEV
jgi:hypothetical protein